jgi:hypothetical protein
MLGTVARFRKYFTARSDQTILRKSWYNFPGLLKEIATTVHVKCEKGDTGLMINRYLKFNIQNFCRKTLFGRNFSHLATAVKQAVPLTLLVWISLNLKISSVAVCREYGRI